MTVAATESIIDFPDLTDGEREFYRREGYLPLPKLLAPDVTALLYDEVMATMAAIGGWEQSKLLQSSEYLAGGPLDRLVHDRQLKDLATLLMEGPSSLYLPFTAVKGPQGGTFHFHQDNN